MSDRVTREGQQLGNYRLLRLLGRGGFAEVYLGEHIYLKSQAALKLLHVVLQDEEREAFLEEAQILVRLNHPHIVRVLDFAVEDGTPFLVMEYALAGTLRQRHPKGSRLPLETIIPYVKDAAEALQYVHDQQLIHRDVKPENLLLNSRNEVLLSDFGLSVLAPHTHGYSTQPIEKSLAGTAFYLAPEQLHGRPQAASDQYTLGVVAYEWLCGRPPFRGSFIEMVTQHLSAPPPSLLEQVPDLSPAVEAVVMRALAKEPLQRFARIQDFAMALEQASQEATLHLSLPNSTQEGELTRIDYEQAHSPTSPLKLEPLWKVPATFTPLIGRKQEIAAVSELLSSPEVRLLTLLGPGGIGKTRLSLQIATTMREAFADGVCFVALDAIRDAALVVPTIATALGIREVGEKSLLEQVKIFLRDKRLLLLLDNFEQVVTAAAQVEELLSAGPWLKIVVTSRAVLHVQGEQQFPVSPLALPDLKQLPEIEPLLQYAAVALFVQRAKAILPTFQVTPANARVLAEICVRLDGLPLAIELAAARIKLLPPQALLGRLTQGLQVLTSESRTLQARQQTLRNTIKWSYDLLDAQEQRLFHLLSVFVGGCSLEAIEIVCEMAGDGASNVLERAESLIDKNLLLQVEQAHGEPRLLMLETIREYGLECLAASGEAEEARRAHAGYYLKLAEETEPQFRSAQQANWFERLEREHDNVRMALRWLIEWEQVEMALRMSGALWRFWSMSGRLSEGRQWLEGALSGSKAGSVSTQARAKALLGAGSLAYNQGDYHRGKTLCQESLVLFRELGNRRGIAASISGLAYIAHGAGDYVRACAMYEESLAIFRELDDTWNIAETLYLLAVATSFRGEPGDQAAAQSMGEASMALFKEMEDQRGTAFALNLLGFVSMLRGHIAEAQPLIEESMAIHRALGNRQGMAYSFLTFGWFNLSQGDHDAARAMYEEGLKIMIELGDKWFIAACLEGLAIAGTSQGHVEWAARLWGCAEAIRQNIGSPMRAFELAINEWGITATRTQLGEEAFAAAWAEGRSMTPEQVLSAQGPVTILTPIQARQAPTSPMKPSSIYPDGLTVREVEVLRLVATGLTNEQVAEQLVISPRTVTTHLTSIYNKIQTPSRSAATRYAIEHHLV